MLKLGMIGRRFGQCLIVGAALAAPIGPTIAQPTSSVSTKRSPGADTRQRASEPIARHFSTCGGPVLIRAVLLAFLVMFDAIGPAAAGDDLFAGVEVLEPERLVELVQARNADLEAVRATADEAATRIKSAGALEDPMLSYKLAPATIGSRELGTRQGIEVSQRFPWLGTRRARETRAEAESEAAQSETAMRWLEIAADTKAVFAEWSFIHAASRINRRQQSHLENLKAAMETSYAAGLAREQDVFKASLELARMKNDALAIENQRRTIQARINALLNRVPAANLPEPAPLKSLEHAPSFDQLEAVAIARHPKLKGLEATLKATGAGITLARKSFYPDVTLQAGYDEFWDEDEKKKRPSVGVSINVPLYWERREAELAGAEAARRKAEWRLADRKAALLAALAEALAGADQANQSVILHREGLVPLAGAAVSAALADYRRGTGDFSSVIDAERGKLDQELSLERALADHYRSLAALEQAIGGPLGDIEAAPHPPAADRIGDQQEHHP